MTQSDTISEFTFRTASGVEVNGVDAETQLIQTGPEVEDAILFNENGRVGTLELTSSQSVTVQLQEISLGALLQAGYEDPIEALQSDDPEDEEAVEEATVSVKHYTVNGAETFGSFSEPVQSFGAASAIRVQAMTGMDAGEQVSVNLDTYEHEV